MIEKSTAWSDFVPEAFQVAKGSNGNSFESEGVVLPLLALVNQARIARYKAEERRRAGYLSVGASYDRVADACMEAYRLEAQSS